jgi:hypothetical protein
MSAAIRIGVLAHDLTRRANPKIRCADGAGKRDDRDVNLQQEPHRMGRDWPVKPTIRDPSRIVISDKIRSLKKKSC